MKKFREQVSFWRNRRELSEESKFNPKVDKNKVSEDSPLIVADSGEGICERHGRLLIENVAETRGEKFHIYKRIIMKK